MALVEKEELEERAATMVVEGTGSRSLVYLYSEHGAGST
jgi:hypothetical protein